MQTLSPSTDRLAAALRALRLTDEGLAPQQLGAKCLAVVIDHLQGEGLSEEDLRPLVALKEAAAKGRAASSSGDERRKRRPPSDAFLGRISAVIDLLVKAGHDESEAAQAIMRRLVSVGVAAPESGGDARGWKRLLIWRSHLLHGVVSREAQEAYEEFVEELEKIPPERRVSAVLSDNLWDRRRKRAEAQAKSA